MVNTFYIRITLVLRKGKVNLAEDRINDMRFKIFYEGTKSVGMENGKDMSRESIKSKPKGNIFIVGKLKALSTRDSIEQLDKFVGNVILFEEYIVFNRKEDVG